MMLTLVVVGMMMVVVVIVCHFLRPWVHTESLCLS